MFGLTHFLEIAEDRYSFSEGVQTEASVFVILFCLLYGGTRFIILRRGSSRLASVLTGISDSHMRGDEQSGILYAGLAVSAVYSIAQTIRTAGGFMSTAWGLSRKLGVSASYVNFSGHLGGCAYYALSGLFLCSLLRKERGGIFISALCILSVAIITRNRITVTPLLAGGTGFLLIRVKKIKLSFILLGVLAGVATFFIVYGLHTFRHYGSLGNALANVSISGLLSRISGMLKDDSGELGLYKWFYYFIMHNNSFKSFGRAHTYLRMLMVFVPTRFAFGLKPDDFAIAMGSAAGMGPGGSMHPTLFGDCYANLGFAGIFLGILWALLVTQLDRIILSMKTNESKVLAYSLMASMYIIIGRGAVYNAFFNVAYGSLFLVLTDKILRRYCGFVTLGRSGSVPGNGITWKGRR